MLYHVIRAIRVNSSNSCHKKAANLKLTAIIYSGNVQLRVFLSLQQLHTPVNKIRQVISFQ